MTSDSGQPSALGPCLQRLEALIETLRDINDERARSIARELLEASMDLHGLALARLITIAQSGADGATLVGRFAADDYVAAVMLLHGLHPEEAEVRLRKKIAALRPHWGVRGFRVDLLAVDSTSARARVHWAEGGDPSRRPAARREIEAALTEAAPDLDRIIVEDDDDMAPAEARMAALENSTEL